MFKKKWLLSGPIASSVNEADWQSGYFYFLPTHLLTQSKNPIQLLPELVLDGKESSLCSYSSGVLAFLVVEAEDGAKPGVADIQYSNYC